MSSPIAQELVNAGFNQSDIMIAQKLTRRGLESHYNIIDKVRNCEKCELATECHGQDPGVDTYSTTRRVTGTGPWNSPLMVIGDMPGEEEGKYYVPFIGAEGQLLTMILSKAGIDRNAIYMTYAVKCAGTRTPEENEMAECSKHLQAEIEAVNPKVVLTVGELAKQITSRGKYELIHTHSMRTMLEGNNIKKYKKEIWDDIVLAANTVRKAKPNYTYDRVGLKTI